MYCIVTLVSVVEDLTCDWLYHSQHSIFILGVHSFLSLTVIDLCRDRKRTTKFLIAFCSLEQYRNDVRHLMDQCAVKMKVWMPPFLFFRYVCGSLEYYEKSYDRVTTKNEVPLAGVNRIFHKVTTTDDPIIRKVCADCPFRLWPTHENNYYDGGDNE